MLNSSLIFIILCVHNFDSDLFAEQVKSIYRQTYKLWSLVILPDGEQGKLVQVLEKLNNTRLLYYPQNTKLGATKNFERGLKIAVSLSSDHSDLFAYCDQDDIWEPNKLERQVAAMKESGSVMCHHDASVIDAQGHQIHPSLFEYERRKKQLSFLELLAANNATGMTMLFNKQVAEATQHHPASANAVCHHDWWTALVAHKIGKIAFLDRPLVQYRQHGLNVIGAIGADARRRSKRPFQVKRFFRMCQDMHKGREQAIVKLNKLIPLDHQNMPRSTALLFHALIWRVEGQRQRARHALFIALGSLTNHLPASWQNKLIEDHRSVGGMNR